MANPNETAKYYTVVAKATKASPWQPQFGDYNRDVVQDEMADMFDSCEWFKLKLICTDDSQEAIDLRIDQLNSD